MSAAPGAATRLDAAARQAVESACARVLDATAADDVDGRSPALVARPDDVDQVREVMRAAAAHDLALVPRGGGTKLGWGLPPTAVDVVLDLSGLDQVLDHAAGDLILAAQAGTPLRRVQEVAAEGGQRLSLDETVPGATLGGTLATNASGARRVAVGTTRDLLIGVTLVRHDGVLAKAGGRVVKNVAGYDLGKLLIGSFGTLGVVVEVTYRLHPVPETALWVSAPAATPEAAHELAQSAVHSPLVPAAVEVEWDAGRGAVHVLLEGRGDAVSGRAARLREIFGAGSSETAEPPAAGATYPWSTEAGAERDVALKLTHRIGGLREVLVAADQVGASVRGSAGAGALYAALPHATTPERAATALDTLRAACTAVGGSAVVLDAPGPVKQALDVWGPVPAIDLMRRVKQEFDPGSRLAPGRFVGGI